MPQDDPHMIDDDNAPRSGDGSTEARPAEPESSHGNGAQDIGSALVAQELGGQAPDFAATGSHQDGDVGSLINAALGGSPEPAPVAGPDGHTAEAAGPGGDFQGAADGTDQAYDGHVPLAFDSDFLPAIDTTLDLLTTSTDLFDVPAIDFGSGSGDG